MKDWNLTSKDVVRFMEDFDQIMDRDSIRIVLDVGSRDAIVALLFKGRFPKATIYAFECNPQAIELCKKNIGDRADIILVDKAVSDECGPVNFYAMDSDGNIGASSLYITNPAYQDQHQNKIEVEAITLKQWAADSGVDAVDLLWMDLQGAELKALKGMGDLLQTVKIIYTEVMYKEMYFDQPLFNDIDLYLASRGFHLCTKPSWTMFGNAIYIRNDFTLPEGFLCRTY